LPPAASGASKRLLELFFEVHDPTQLNRQGPDIGTQYRSAIFFHDADQETAAREAKARLQASGELPEPVVTEISAASEFWRAEDYHQRYFEKSPLRRMGWS
jgi:peptide-methionine (S)-S-oxide reductase